MLSGSQTMARLELRLLGGVEVIRAGIALPLPASRKARALLAYLAATGRSHRRGQLCALFWDTPDDPRGALRSALSRLRTLVDEPDRPRILTEGDTVRLDMADVEVDLIAVQRLYAQDDGVSSSVLEAAAAIFRGGFLEGLALSNCPDFDTWCLAEREETRRLQVQILHRLIERSEATPEAALPHARTLVRVDREALGAHVALLRLLVASGHQREAEEQHALSLRTLAESSESAARELTFTWRTLAPSQGESEANHPPAVAEPSDVEAAFMPPAKPTILVLPFANLSGDPEQDYFSDGITEDIITDLSRVSSLSVVPRSTAFSFKGQAVEIDPVARRLGVAYVLEGSVRKAGSRVRITAQLVEVATGTHLWAERFDRMSSDVFALQDEISESAVSALKLRLLPDELEAIQTRPTSSARAYRFYLEARAKLAVSWSNKETLRAARKLLVKAIRIDPGYARAYAAIADSDAFLWVNGDLDVSYEDMLVHSSKALELAPDLAEAHASKGIALYVAGQPKEAIPALKRAMELDAELFEARFFYGMSCRDAGNLEEAAQQLERAARLQTRNHQPLTMLADVYTALGLKAESEAAARRSLRRISDAFGPKPEVAEVLAMGAVTLVMIGEYGRAGAWVRRALLLDPESYSVRYNAACTYAVIGRPDLAVQSLDHAFRHMPRARGWIYHSALQDAQLRSLQGRADFQDLLERLAADARTDSLRQDVRSAAGVSGD